MKRWMFGFAAVAMLVGVQSASAAPFLVNFDENGNGSFSVATAVGIVSGVMPGAVLPDPADPGTIGLTYFLPVNLSGLVNNGDVLILEPGSTITSDMLRFTDANGSLVGRTADRMIYYSDIEPNEPNTDLADLPFRVLHQNGTIVEVGPEGNNGFDWQPDGAPFPNGNEYIGISDTPEPATMTLLGMGLVGMAGYGYRRRKVAKA